MEVFARDEDGSTVLRRHNARAAQPVACWKDGDRHWLDL